MPGVPASPREALCVDFMPQLARRVGVQQVIAQHAVLHHHRAPRGQPFAIEGRSAEAARARRQQHRVVVDDGQVGRRNRLAQLARPETMRRARWRRREAASNTEPISERATSGANTIGTRCVGTRRAPSRRSVRRAASCPTASGDSRCAKLRALDHQPSRCIWPFASMASGAADTPA